MKVRYAKIMENDIVDGEGICVSLWTQGCPHHCKGCHNPETWDFNGGIEGESTIIIDNIIQHLRKNGIKRNLSILGGEPLCPENRAFIYELIKIIRLRFENNIKIYLWTGYTFDELKKEKDSKVYYILDNINYLIEGRYVEEQRDITLKLRGSTNQRIFNNIRNNNETKNNTGIFKYSYDMSIR